MSEPRPLPDLARELWELVVAYVRQETLEPIKGLGRWLAFGAVGSLLIGTGLAMLALSGLRVLQTEVDWGTGASYGSALPYFITFGATIVLAGLSLLAASRGGDS